LFTIGRNPFANLQDIGEALPTVASNSSTYDNEWAIISVFTIKSIELTFLHCRAELRVDNYLRRLNEYAKKHGSESDFGDSTSFSVTGD
jgi:hypothetical protein